MRYFIAFFFIATVFCWACKKNNPADDGFPISVEVPVVDHGGSSSEQNDITDEPTYVKVIRDAKWDVTQLSGSVVWKYHHFMDLFSAKQSINIFNIDLNGGNVSVEIPYVKTGYFLKTSDAAASVNAIAAVNGSYFDTQHGGSSAFFIYHGSIIASSTFIAPWRSNAGLSIDRDGKVTIISEPATGWGTVTNTYDLLASGPLLIYNGEIQNQIRKSYNYDRYPRTGIGLTKDNHLIAIVVDGRSDESAGLTIDELSKVMKTLGCHSAMSMDSGGSATAWVKNKGVVNYPSDNGKFDHAGERAVATVIAFVLK